MSKNVLAMIVFITSNVITCQSKYLTIDSSLTQSLKRIKREANVESNNRLIVSTSSGLVEGKTLKVLDSNVHTFLGIPYAEPPIGDSRFGRPVPIKPWKDIKPTMSFSAMCAQNVIPRDLVPMVYITENITEDCLTINIWTPDIKPKALKTVMVWVHGGAFQYNSANLEDTDGSVLSTHGDVVVVSLNYRVGLFGFLNAKIASAPGNMALYDQSLALNWIKQNIYQFGGDPNQMVPFGQSFGSAAINILMTMNSTKNLFSRAITQSGSALLPPFILSDSFEKSEKLSKLIGCADNNEFKTNPEKVVQCLKRVPLSKLLEVQSQILNYSQAAFYPTAEGFFKDVILPADLLGDKNTFSNMKELLAGVVPNEGSYLMHSSSPQVFGRHTYPVLRTIDETRNMYIWYLTEKVGLNKGVAKLIAFSMIYGPESDSPENNINKLTQTFGDNIITCPTVYLADELSARNKKVYMYLYDHRSKATKFGEWQGISHYEEVPFVFGYPLRKSEIYSNEDIVLSKRIMTIWSHFAKTGDVLPQFHLNWPQYKPDKSYMVLKPEIPSIIHNFRENICKIFKASFKLIGPQLAFFSNIYELL